MTKYQEANMKFEVSGGLGGYTIQFIDNRSGGSEHSYWLQVIDRNGKQLLNDIKIGKEDLKRIARGTDNPR